MSYQVLARKWRPKKFSEVIGQPHVTRTLGNSVLNEKVAHAYLLTGTRGVGKTTIARIFAKAIRCTNRGASFEPCLECDACIAIDNSASIDFLEIDGASNNSVEDIRDLIENVQYLPTTGKYKVYVVDEVHMLTVNAFNALLKTLEEPPEHVVFIFATTDPQKLLGTVLSRCQRLDFKHVSPAEINQHLIKICESENIQIEGPRITQAIAKYARGSVRDSLSILDQVVSLSLGDIISEAEMTNALGLISNSVLNEIVSAILLRQKSTVAESYKKALIQNVDLEVLCQQVQDELYQLIEGLDEQGELQSAHYSDEVLVNLSVTEIFWLYETLAKDFNWALSSLQPEQAIGFVLCKSCLREQILTGQHQTISLKKKDKTEESTGDAKLEPLEELAEVSAEEPVEILAKKDLSWQGFIAFVLENNRALAVNIEHGNVKDELIFSADSDRMNLIFSQKAQIFYDFVNEPENISKLRELLQTYLQRDNVKLDTELLTGNDEKEFQSTVEIHESNLKRKDEQDKQDILDNKFIQDAEKIFNTKVDKVVLNKG